jgi:hypothetical protein
VRLRGEQARILMRRDGDLTTGRLPG